ncbi:cytochrome C [Scytonema hofmannii PCC 7110]|uniref:Cytochrome C n=1 Tax=Scytonema hofmannii PCC 7110 TaxID=128403 RepID=A0A139X665_9CYAN|nr:diheme cytochrome c [Scytonema hofmannii]KYC40165.1 cytochrome C [Scytonema hofmannii PCC 7110]
MSKIVKRRFRNQKLKGKPLGFLLVILAWSLAMGWLLAMATQAQGAPSTTSSHWSPITGHRSLVTGHWSLVTDSEIGTVDVVPAQQRLGQELYLENCASCHIALPPAVLPTQTWRNLLEDSQHYGVQIKPLIDPPRILVWRYLSAFSRPQLLEDEQIPYRVGSSRYFRALHPNVKLPKPVQIGSCVTCHPSASDFNFRRLTQEWE